MEPCNFKNWKIRSSKDRLLERRVRSDSNNNVYYNGNFPDLLDGKQINKVCVDCMDHTKDKHPTIKRGDGWV